MVKNTKYELVQYMKTLSCFSGNLHDENGHFWMLPVNWASRFSNMYYYLLREISVRISDTKRSEASWSFIVVCRNKSEIKRQ